MGRIILKHDDIGGFALIENDAALGLEMLDSGWRPVTRREKFLFDLRRPRFSVRDMLIFLTIALTLRLIVDWLT